MDTRGWAAKNAEYQTSVVAPVSVHPTSDRLIAPAPITQTIPADLHASDDIMDVDNNATAQSFDKIMEEVAERTRKEALARMTQTPDNNLADASSSDSTPNTPEKVPVYNPAPVGMHQKVLSPVHSQSYQQNNDVSQAKKSGSAPQNSNTSTMTPPTSDVILGLANERGDNLSVETIAKEASRLESLDSDKTVALH
ncbi:MAG: hypothetical protein DRP42_07220 [Tenericutes bacterium]|nr:MAG: hypothetical protein DRP42_07220 [Mycoplasmatota bacterium]